MRVLILAVSLMLAGAATAQPINRIMWLENEAGGEITLTDLQSEACNGLHTAMATAGSRVRFGCWQAVAAHIVIDWEGGDRTAYRADDFIMDPAYEAALGESGW